MPQVSDSDRGAATASVEAVRIARTCLAGEDVCALLVGHDNRCLYATPLATPLVSVLARLDAPPVTAEYTTLGALLAQMRRSGRASAGMVGAADDRLIRVFDVTVMPAADADRNAEVALIVGRDVTLATSMRRTLVESRQRYKDLVEVSAAFAWETNADGTLVFVSPQGVLGYGVDELVGRQPEAFLAEPLDGGSLHPFTTREPTSDVEVWMRRADGSAVCLLISAVPLYDDAGRWTGARGVCRDITDVRERDIAIARSRNRERLLSFIVRSFRDEVDPENMLTIAAATVAQGVGVSGCNVLRARPPEEPRQSSSELAVAASFGRVGGVGDLKEVIATFAAGHDIVETVIGKWNVLAAVTRYRQQVNGGIVLWRELSRVPYDEDDRILLSDLSAQVGIAIEQISNHEHILALSRTDALTGLYNRRAFIEELERRTQRLRHDVRSAALLYVDLDNFKMVNDLFGHKRGDDALFEVKRLLQSATRPSDLVARLGGDEFAVWMDGVGEDVAVAKAKGLLEASKSLESFSGGLGRSLSMSIGIAVYDPVSDESIDALLSRADGAMYQTKHSGKGSFRVAPATM